MRSVVMLVGVLAACGDDGGSSACSYQDRTYGIGDVFPTGDGCNSCTCTVTGVACTEIACADAGVDANPASCAPTSGCPSGPACGTICCDGGERCDNGICKCGTATCGAGDSCEAPGPIGERDLVFEA
jgi:hypothetical protein